MQAHLIYLSGVLGLGIAAQWIAWRLRLPAILLLLVFGFGFGLAWGRIADPEIATVDAVFGRELLFAVISLSVAVILFEGGLNLRIRELRETGHAVFRLVAVGIPMTWLLSTASAWLLLGFDLAMAALAGAILVVTGPTVIMPLLRQVRPARRVESVVKWEGIINDPIGAVLAVLVFQAILAGGFRQAAAATFGGLVATVAVGGVTALGAGLALIGFLKRYWIPDHLQNAAFLGTVVVVFAVSNRVQPESGLVSVTLLGILLANQKTAPIHHVIEFKENLRVLLISCLFILLASRLKLDDLTALGMGGVLFLAAMLLVVRPAAVLLAALGTDLRVKERVFLAWLAPRGIVAAAVSAVFALELAGEGLVPEAQAQQLTSATFLVIVGTVAIYGLTAGPLARWLQIAESDPQGVLFAGAGQVVRAVATALKDEGYQVLLVDTNQHHIATARMAGLPTCWANVTSAYALEEINLGGIGRLLAMTPNDEVNALAAQEFAEFFGSASVYQLPPRTGDTVRQQRMAPGRMGRLLFGPDVAFSRLTQRMLAGAVVKKTNLTEEFDYQSFRTMYGESAIVLFAIDESRKLIVSTAEDPLEPQPGQTLISMVDPVEPDESTKA